MNTATVDSPDDEQTRAWWFLDTLVIEHRCAPDMETVVMEMTLPVGSSAPLHVHDTLDDTWYILDGELVVHCGERHRRLEQGTGCRCRAACHTRSGWSVTGRHASSWFMTTPAFGI